MVFIEDFLNSGELFDNRYKILRPLSMEGGSADVWLAVDAKTVEDPEQISDLDWVDGNTGGLQVAIKVYRPKNALDIDGEQRFREEFKIVFNCHHSNLVQPTFYSIYEGLPYLVLPYCRNGSSEMLVGEIRKEEDIWKYIHDVASGLAYLHALEPPIIHQDIKPANVLIDDTGNYAITDFGISALSGLTSPDVEGDEVSGTFAYMAPERFDMRAEPCKESDIWAFGATLYEVVTGKLPLGSSGGAGQTTPHPKLDFTGVKLSPDIKKLMEACLSMDPNKRPTAENLVQMADLHLKKKNSWVKKGAFAAVALIVLAGAAWWAMNNMHVEVKGKKVTLQKDGKMDDAVTYSGSLLLKGVPDGKGKARYSDGATYEGNFVNGKRDDDNAKFVVDICEYGPCTFVNDKLTTGVLRYVDNKDTLIYDGPFDDNGSPYYGTVNTKNIEFKGKLEFNPQKKEWRPCSGIMKNKDDGDLYDGYFDKNGDFWDGVLYDKNGKKIYKVENGKYIPIQ